MAGRNLDRFDATGKVDLRYLETLSADAVPVIVELFYQSYQFGQRTFQIMPGIVAATLWYLIVCSILMVGQARLERYFGRGFGAVPQRTQQKLAKIEAEH